MTASLSRNRLIFALTLLTDNVRVDSSTLIHDSSCSTNHLLLFRRKVRTCIFPELHIGSRSSRCVHFFFFCVILFCIQNTNGHTTTTESFWLTNTDTQCPCPAISRCEMWRHDGKVSAIAQPRRQKNHFAKKEEKKKWEESAATLTRCAPPFKIKVKTCKIYKAIQKEQQLP